MIPFVLTPVVMAQFSIPFDLQRYRKGYPNEKLNDTSKNRNVLFYQNKIECEPDGGNFIEFSHPPAI